MAMQLIPALDLWEGRCVRLRQGDFAQQRTYSASPAEILRGYEEAGAQWVHIVDLEGARSGDGYHHALIAGLVACTRLKLQVGGGIRSPATIEVLLAAGVSRVIIGSAALETPHEVRSWIELFGADRVGLAFDVRTSHNDEPRVYTRGWAQSNPATLGEALAPYSDVAVHILCTDILRDGTLSGPNFSLYERALERFPDLQWQASGGIRTARDLATLADLKVSAAISGRALLENRIPYEELQPYLPDASSRALMSATVRS